MATGKIKWFNAKKGFGFITPDDGGSDVFVHYTALEQAGIPAIEEGDAVSYEIMPDNRQGKNKATNIVLI